MEGGTVCGVDIPGLPEKDPAPRDGAKSVVHQNRYVLDICGLLGVRCRYLEREDAR